MTESLVDAKVSCPRCGYDQRGVMAQWQQQCPLQGTCAECGLEFNWPELIAPQKFEPKWCIEFAPKGRQFRACMRTVVACYWPWRFWARMNMAFDVHWRRIGLLWLFVLLMLLGSLAIRQATAAIVIRVIAGQNAVAHAKRINANETAAILTLWGMLHDQSNDVTMSLLPEARAQTIKELEARVAELEDVASEATDALPSYWLVVFDAVVLPLKDSSDYEMPPESGWWGFDRDYPAPSWQLSYLARRWGGRGSDAYEFFNVCAILGLFTALALFVMMPVLFVLVPVSRKRAKVRWRHIWRVAGYSIVLPVLLWCMVFLCMAVGVLHHSTHSAGMTAAAIVVLLPTPALVIWWATAINRYLRIGHGWIVSIVFTILILLLAFWLTLGLAVMLGSAV